MVAKTMHEIINLVIFRHNMEILGKSLSRSAAEHDEELQTLRELEITRLNGPDWFVFLDESTMDNKPFRGLKAVSCWWSFGTFGIV